MSIEYALKPSAISVGLLIILKMMFDNMLHNMLRLKESKTFWTALKKPNNKKEADYISCISLDSRVDHFQKVLREENDPEYPADDEGAELCTS